MKKNKKKSSKILSIQPTALQPFKVLTYEAAMSLVKSSAQSNTLNAIYILEQIISLVKKTQSRNYCC
ncbi:hypothetical protein BST96_09225 [Oceanicoccus sagamiensis]|uniref:Uncharacterized protein n=1 Tax=Oceanicoccus sagamiensis TaxID=716816 RepID=A0A1X9NH82_9GAMM|nr:hypothetical protein BST96_09225 [Oceanicoccus sagamiensis]